MNDAGDLGLAPALLHVQGADDVGPALAAESDVARFEPADGTLIQSPSPSHLRAAAGSADRARAFRRQRGREAAAERGRVGQQQGFIVAFAIGRQEVREIVPARGEREERLRHAGGDARPGDIGGVDIDNVVDRRRLDRVEAIGYVGVEVKMANERPVGGVRGHVETEVHARRPAGRFPVEGRVLLGVARRNQEPWCRGSGNSGRKRHAGDCRIDRASGPVVLGVEIATSELGSHEAAEFQASVRARQRPAGDAADVAHLDIVDRRRLPGRQIGRLSKGDGDDTSCGTEQKALDERCSSQRGPHFVIFPANWIQRSIVAISLESSFLTLEE